mgnify:CR=1 FL=1
MTREEMALSGNTPIRLTLVIAIVSAVLALVAGIAGAIYWAGTVSTTLVTIQRSNESILSTVNGLTSENRSFGLRLQNLEIGGTDWMQKVTSQIAEFNTRGSPALAPKVSALERDVNLLQGRLTQVEKFGSDITRARLEVLERSEDKKAKP